MRKGIHCCVLRCNKPINSLEEGIQSYGKGWYCNSCYPSRLRKAEDTGSLHYKDHLKSFIVKDSVGNRISKFYYREITGHVKCPSCKDYYEGESIKLKTLFKGKKGCTYCHKDFESKKNTIRNSGAKVVDFAPIRTPSPDGLLMGMEWEISCEDNRLSSVVLEALGYDFAISKYDGSVRGFEINTAPSSLYLQKLRVKKACEVIKKYTHYDPGTSNAGIHIHVDRRFFSKEGIEKFISFFCISKNTNFIKCVAGRLSSNWAKRVSKDTYNEGMPWYSASSHEGKCAIVNTCHTNTLEVRAFASSLDFLTIAARLEFVAALARACKEDSFPVEANYKKFIVFLNSKKASYPNLVQYLKKQAFL